MAGHVSLITQELIENKIFFIRGEKVIMDRDLASLYGVLTKVLNQAVKRNKERFPNDFMFQLNSRETKKLVTKRDRFKTLWRSLRRCNVFSQPLRRGWSSDCFRSQVFSKDRLGHSPTLHPRRPRP